MVLIMRGNALLIEKHRSVVDNDRGHSIVIDLPFEHGGDDTGPTSLELAVMGLAGCVTTIYSLVAAKRRFKFDGMKVEVEAVKPDEEKTVTKVKGNIKIWSENREEAETVLRLTLDNCPVHVLFEKANVEISWDVTIEQKK
ncbi:MAG: OsmC family protein [Aigarchaeota archaeon]|nr:OsmC family protein [Aigarchaeota archaeon]MCX8192301.1 OsmC family protein [Nitrososphaeria archaeon]MDW7986091.1 OsmC family protein [Nitrososphaerota archaeon]